MRNPSHGGVLAARALNDSGVETVFALPGGHILPLFEGARVEGLRLIDTRHEENAVFMAEGWALATGEPAAAAVTAGPGLANAFAGLAEANAAGVPVVMVSGRTGVGQRHRGPLDHRTRTRRRLHQPRRPQCQLPLYGGESERHL